MRALAALAIYVFLTAGVRAEQPVLSGENTQQQSGTQPFRQPARLAEANAWLERARREWAANPEQDSQQGMKLALATADLANLYRSAADYNEAEKLLRELIAAPANDRQVMALIRNNLADLLREEGRDTEAEPLFQQSVDAAGITARERAAAFIGLADIDRECARWNRSIEKWNSALEIARREQDRHTEAIVLRGMGATWLQSGSPARGEPLLRRALKFMDNDPGTPRELLAGAHSSLGELYRAENKLALAEDEWTRALEMDRTVLGEVHPQVAWLMEMLSDVFSARGEFLLGRDYATRAAEMMRATFGEESMPMATALANRALVELRAGDTNSAATDYQRAIRIGRSHPEHQLLENALIRRYADLLKTMHRGREAKALLVQRNTSSASFSLK